MVAATAATLVVMGPDPRYPRWIRIGVWAMLVAVVAMVLTSVALGF